MKIISIIVAGGLLAAFCLTAMAQTNVLTVTNVVTVQVTNVVTVTNIVVRAPVPAPVGMAKQYPWESSLSAGLSLTRGNSQSLLYSGDFKTAKKTPDNEFMFGIGGAYGSQNSTESVNNYKTDGQWNHFFSTNFFGYVIGDASRDLIAGVDYRFNIGPGIGYYLVKNKRTTLALESGVGYQSEHLFGVGGYKSFATVRQAERFEHKLSDQTKIWQKIEFLPQVDEFDNYVVNLEIGVEVSISKSFSLKTALTDSYQNKPAVGRKNSDLKLISCLSYKF